MKKIGIFYGSTTGTTCEIADKIAEKLGVDKNDIHDVAKCAPSDVDKYDMLVLGSSTWGNGELQDDWRDFITGLEQLDLKDKEIALFGTGDETMGDTFCSAIGELYRSLKPTGATFVAPFNADGYDFAHTGADVDGVIVGLVLDNVNHEELTDKRIEQWCYEVESYLQ